MPLEIVWCLFVGVGGGDHTFSLLFSSITVGYIYMLVLHTVLRVRGYLNIIASGNFQF